MEGDAALSAAWPLMIVVHFAATAFMAGLIWFVQIVHYPLFDAVGRDAFVAYERRHVRATGWVVGPAMLTEAATAVLILPLAEAGAVRWLAWVGFVLLGVVWLSTALLQVPCHRRLERAYDAAAVRRLVRTNWVRTAAWSGRLIVAGLLVFKAMGSAAGPG